MTAVRSLVRPLVRTADRSLVQRGGGGTDADALAWAAAVTLNGGVYSAGTLAAVSNFVKAAKGAGYWDKLNRINLFCGGATPSDASAAALAACLVPLKVGGGSATETNVNFVSGDYTEATGLTGNGTTKYLQTGLIPSVSLTLNDTHYAIYNRGASATGGNIGLGARDGTNYLEIYAPFSNGNFGWRSYGIGEVFSAVVAPYGLMVGSTISAANAKAYQNGVQTATGSPTAGALVAFEVYVMASNNSGAPIGLLGSQPLAAYSIGSGLTAGDVTAYNTHMEAFQDALGRGVN